MFLSPNFDGIIACVLTLNYKCDCDRGIDELNFQVDNKEPKRCRCIVSSVSELAYNKRRQTFAHTDYDTVNILSFRPLCCMLNVTDGKYLDGLHKEANIQLWFTLTLQQSWYKHVWTLHFPLWKELQLYLFPGLNLMSLLSLQQLLHVKCSFSECWTNLTMSGPFCFYITSHTFLAFIHCYFFLHICKHICR